MNIRSDIGTIPIAEDCDIRVVDAARVAMVQAALPDAEVIEALADGVFTVLADPSRLRLIIGLLGSRRVVRLRRGRSRGTERVGNLACSAFAANGSRRQGPPQRSDGVLLTD